ncbi:MAG: alpha-glucosidase C-terminal domain-containing protein [Flavobacteriales bacterium]|nr:alpha-glucosidase C-terminal domain-containing protein [Flavobacteriales bacterium]
MKNYLLILFALCSTNGIAQERQFTTPEWSKNATIYEVNIRQYSKEGTFAEVEKRLPQLKMMGIDIIWLMPIHPIGEKNRKGGEGSYYAVKDYSAVNPKFGTLEEFKSLVNTAHDLDLKVIIDWVANHSAPDNVWVDSNIEFYTKDEKGNAPITVPGTDWYDVADLNYDEPGLRQAMTDALVYWVKETNIDGYRCDVAEMVPLDFWIDARKEIEKIKQVFMLAEGNSSKYFEAFDMVYDWDLYESMHVNKDEAHSTNKIVSTWLAKHNSEFPTEHYKMLFTDNHDKNSWDGTPQENFGNFYETAIVLSALMDGMPLVYSGQEAGNSKSLKFFEKDQIEWRAHKNLGLYKKLFDLKHKNQALWNGKYGGRMVQLESKDDNVFAFYRQKNGDRVVVVANMSTEYVDTKINTKGIEGKYRDLFKRKDLDITKSTKFMLQPYEYKVLVKIK